MGNTIARLTGAALLPVALAVLFYLAEKKTGFARLPYAARQIIIGLAFGGVACLATEFGIPIQGAVLNVRSAAPLTAGLIFGGPAGIIAGIIGGVYRWLATLWGAGAYTRVGCTIATIVAGFFAAGCRKHMFDNKKPSWFYGLAIGLTTEVMHMLALFLTNMNDIHTAFTVVTQCALPMITANSLSVMCALLAVALLGKEKLSRAGEMRQISQVFQLALLVCVLAAFAATSLFTNTLQTRIADADVDELLKLNLNDVESDINDASDRNLLELTYAVAARATPQTDSEQLAELAREMKVAEINIIDENGIIVASTVKKFVGYDMSSGRQSSEFMCLLYGVDEVVQSYQPTSYDRTLSRKYAGVVFDEGGFLQVGYDASQFHADIAAHVVNSAGHRHIGQSGRVIICDEAFNVVSESDGGEGVSVAWNAAEQKEDERFTAAVNGEESYCVYTVTEGYYIIAAIPVSEANFSRDIAVYVNYFMEILVFAALFITIFFLIKRLVVDNIHKINSSLAEITGGNLDVTVDVRDNKEFASLSDDINATVHTLKRYIAEAAARIDRELEFARQIQRSALPSVFPPYPQRADFEIYASMDPAKEVGGDFYDFYLLNKSTLVMLVADVSGKGIPAAMFMMTAKTQIKSLVESGMSPEAVFATTNAKLCENNEANMFLTAWLGVLNLKTGALSYVNAGHNPPLVRRAGGEFEYLRVKSNFILAGMGGVQYTKHELTLAPGDEIYLYTDGVTEATDAANSLYGEQRLLEALNAQKAGGAQRLCEAVKADIERFVGGAPQFDDITMLSVGLRFLQTEHSITTHPSLESLKTVAEFVDGKLSRWLVPPKTANKVRIAVDEIYSNIVRHSGAKQAELVFRRDSDAIVLSFTDDGAPYDPTTEPEPDVSLPAQEREIGGLGVMMVRKFARAMKYERVDDRNALTLTFAL